MISLSQTDPHPSILTSSPETAKITQSPVAAYSVNPHREFMP